MTKTIVITGASDGIGAAAARQLVHAGHHVVIVGRSESKTAVTARALDVDHLIADFAHLEQVRSLAAELAGRYPRIDTLVNNAGAILGKRTVTGDGFEETFQVNYLAPFLLTSLLTDTLLAAKASVIQTSSNAARLSARLDLDDLDNARRYSPMRAYGNAKLALILFTQQLHTRYHARGLSAAAFHPGGVASNFARNSRSVVGTLFRSPLPRLFFQPPEKGARHLVRLAAPGPDQDWESGSYYENGEPCTIKAPPVGRELWDRTVELLGLQSR